jgi:phosphate/sulfate permease
VESDITIVLSHSRPALFILCLALAFAFEFVNGFHDTANAVATVIYTKTLKPTLTVLLSAVMNFLGVFFAGTAVAYGILKLLPPRVLEEYPLEAPLSIVIAALLSSISWNLLTWYRGIPSSSSHTLIGSILGVGLAHSVLPGENFGEGINWGKALDIGLSLLCSPLFGFFVAFALYYFFRSLVKNPKLLEPLAEGETPTPLIRLTLILTCAGVSFSHGSNDGQKGVGLVMLILLAFIPNHSSVVPSWVVVFVALALGIGTTIGWKRIVVTVGEKIGKTHLTPIQGAAAELTAAFTISLSSLFGLPVSTTHVLSSGVAGTMVAKGGGVQSSTIRKIVLAWILTLPVSMAVSFLLFFVLRWLFGLSNLSPIRIGKPIAFL